MRATFAVFVVVFFMCLIVTVSFLITGVYDNLSFEERRARVSTQSQVKFINGIRHTINREGCAEAIGVCDFSSVVRGFGGGECGAFHRTTGRTVKQACCGWWPDLDVCKKGAQK